MRGCAPESPRFSALVKAGGVGDNDQVTEHLLAIAARVIESAGPGKPADDVLRNELRGQRELARGEGRAISQAVFAYYRWLGWLNSRKPLTERIRWALQMDENFEEKPDSIPNSELRRAIPDWAANCVEVTPAWLKELQKEPVLWLRARPGTGVQLEQTLGDCHPAGMGPLADALQYLGSEDLFRTPEFHKGRFELQDLSSQAVGLACAPQPGETWWDACAGEGGKALHLSDLMQNKGLLWVSDRAAWRLQQLKRRTARAGIFNYRSVPWSGGAKLPTKTKFDGVLVDAPCTGVGTWQRNPHARWTTTMQDVQELAAVQKQLVANVVPSLKPGGKLFYAVCTLTRDETTGVAEAITQQFPQLKPLPVANPLAPTEPPVSQLWLWPQDVGGNGMFITAWQMS